MMKTETSKASLFRYLALIVKDFVSGTQLQKVQALRNDHGWIFAFEFYPAPKRFFLAKTLPDGEAKKSDLAVSLKAAENPLQLYIRAHLQNRRLESAEFKDGEFRLNFAGGAELHIIPAENQAEVRVPERKPYRQQLRLADWPEPKDSAETSTAIGATGGSLAPDLATREAKKYRVLLSKVQKDLDEAMAFLGQHQEIFQLLTSAPQNWGQEDSLGAESFSLLKDWVKKGKLKSLRKSALGEAQDFFFSQRKRMERKLAMAQKRLHELGAQNPYAATGSKALRPTKTQPKKKESKFPGIKVQIEEGLLAYIGRSAIENGELFRKMRDRDLWFHVRAEKGAHVWIPRGQKSLPSKGDPSQRILELGAQLALLNSKAEKSGAATVDYTERRYLKSTPGIDGLLRIERSKTIFVRKDLAFEKKIFG
jgi:hypothetical protein